MEHIKLHYYQSHTHINPFGIVLRIQNQTSRSSVGSEQRLCPQPGRI